VYLSIFIYPLARYVSSQAPHEPMSKTVWGYSDIECSCSKDRSVTETQAVASDMI